MKPRSPIAFACLAACLWALPAGALADEGARTDASASQATKLDINTASAGDFEALPKVGPSRAAAIVALRERMHGFRRVEDLMRVRGIGRKTFRDLRPLLTISPREKNAGGKRARR